RVYIPEAPNDFALAGPDSGSVHNEDEVTVWWERATDPAPGAEIDYRVEWSVDPEFGSFNTTTTADTFTTISEVDVIDLWRNGGEFSNRGLTAIGSVKGSGMASLNLNGIGGPPELDELPDDITVFWRVSAVDDYDLETTAIPAHGWSFDIYLYDTPDPFSLIGPADNSTVAVLDTTLIWHSTTDPDPGDELEYVVMWSTDQAFETEVDSVTTPDTTHFVDNLSDDSRYYWKVRAQDSNTPGTWSTEVWSFATNFVEAPTEFALAGPDSGYVSDTGEVDVWWTRSETPNAGDEIRYLVLWSLDPEFAEDVLTGETADTFYTIDSLDELIANAPASKRSVDREQLAQDGIHALNLPRGGVGNLDELPDDITVFWRVEALNTYNLRTTSSPAYGWSFDVFIPDAPEPFELAGPDSGAVIDTADYAVLSWFRTTDPDAGDEIDYRLWWATDSDFTENLDSLNTTDTTSTLLNLLDPATYWWKVRAQDTNTEGTWSDVHSFTMAIPELVGRVVDEESGLPIGGVRIKLALDDSEVRLSAETDSDGRYVFEEIPEGESNLLFIHERYASVRVNRFNIVDNTTLELDASMTALSTTNRPMEPMFFDLVAASVVPEESNARDFFSQLESLVLVEDGSGGILMPPVYNSIGEVDVRRAYRVLISDPDTLLQTGPPINPDTLLSLQAGVVNYMGYPLDYRMPVDVALEEITDEIIVVRNSTGDVYIPNQGVNTLEELEPGRGYYVQVSENVEFTLNDNPWLLADAPALKRERGIADASWAPRPTGLSWTMLVELTEAMRAEAPDLVELYDDGLMVGIAEIDTTEEITTLTAWQGVPEYGLDGYVPGNRVEVVLRGLSGGVIDSRVLEGDLTFGAGAYGRILVDKPAPLPTEFALSHAWPNPFNHTVSVKVELPEARPVKVAVYDLLGRRVHQADYALEAGRHRLNVIADAGWGSGVYFLRVDYGESVQIRKLVLMK
ncbi:T9SS type A sorting domain-containing protein, partial [bacterium]|nr:T9SS type A sorting domain-containing protein [bacterium]